MTMFTAQELHHAQHLLNSMTDDSHPKITLSMIAAGIKALPRLFVCELEYVQPETLTHEEFDTKPFEDIRDIIRIYVNPHDEDGDAGHELMFMDHPYLGDHYMFEEGTLWPENTQVTLRVIVDDLLKVGFVFEQPLSHSSNKKERMLSTFIQYCKHNPLP